MAARIEQSQICPHCGTMLTRPEWSERLSETQIARIWCCSSCGYQYETTVDGAGHEPSAAELAEEFLPDLVVE
jgi:rubredoxin